VVELRQYTLHPGQRDVLIDLFDREFVETQEAEGMTILGQFRDLDDPNRFVWLRGFKDMASRAPALGAFYGGPAWKAHSKAANATMVDATNVLLLRPARAASGFSLRKLRREAPGATEAPKRLLVATIYSFDRGPGDDVVAWFDREAAPLLEGAGASLLGRFVTEEGVNAFPALPVREGEHVFVSFVAYRDASAHERARPKVGGLRPPHLVRPPETLRLAPTARSLL
jgi:quinol monooxygenase YgiN